jgi:hypothetical protein
MLSHVSGQTVAHIDVDGEVRFAHQAEVAKDGKPHRVIVDILSATHQLGSKEFRDVPACIVQAVRTSQFSVKPEKTVRIVFDVNHETVYQIAVVGQHVKVTFPDPEAKSFAEWSTHQVVMAMLNEKKKSVTVARKSKATAAVTKAQPRSAAKLNAVLDSDRMASLAGDNPTPKAVSKPKVQAKPQPVKPPVSESLTGSARQYSDRTRFEVEVAKPVVVAAKKKPVVVSKPLVTKPAVSKPLAVVDKPQAKPVTSKKKAKTSTKASLEPTAKAKGDLSPSKVEPKKKPAAVKTQSSKKAKSTARFRRSPVPSGKIKGSWVAEFPQRLVIKYASSGRRDPFETLVNEAKVYDTPMAERVPNIDGLQLVGVIESIGGDNSALFEDSDSYSYILRAGDKVRKGYVLRVETDRVFFQIFEYGWSRTVALNIED